MTRTRYDVSPWIDEGSKARRPDFPRLRGAEKAAVAIVGGGLTGCLTAYAFAAAGIKVTLLEADRVGHAGGGRGPGILQGEAGASYRDVEARHGRTAARALFEASRRAVLDLATTARRLHVKAPVEVHHALRVHASPGADDKPLRRDADLRRDAGLDAVWLKASAAVRESGVEGARAGVRLHDWGTTDPYRLLIGFAQAAAERGAALFERSVVRHVKVRRNDVEVLVEGGTLAADTVIVCTGEPTDLFRPLKRHVRLEDRYVVLTDRLPSSVQKPFRDRKVVVTDTEVPPHLVRGTADGRLIIAGADQPRQPARGRDKVAVQRTGQLMYQLSRLYPAISGVVPAYGWACPLTSTPDRLLYAGPHRNYPRHLFAWATRHDPAQAFLASRIVLRHYLGQAAREDGYFGFTRG